VASAESKKLLGSDDIGQRGDALYEQHVKPHVAPSDHGKFVAIDIDTGAYEMDANELAAVKRVRERRPGALVWITRVGSRYAHRFGAGHAIDAA
jgi:hypothetical protein